MPPYFQLHAWTEETVRTVFSVWTDETALLRAGMCLNLKKVQQLWRVYLYCINRKKKHFPSGTFHVRYLMWYFCKIKISAPCKTRNLSRRHQPKERRWFMYILKKYWTRCRKTPKKQICGPKITDTWLLSWSRCVDVKKETLELMILGFFLRFPKRFSHFARYTVSYAICSRRSNCAWANASVHILI